MAYTSSSSSDRTSYCPCLRVPLSLSSATSAEYGDVVSLARRIRANNSSSSTKNGGGGGGGGEEEEDKTDLRYHQHQHPHQDLTPP